MADLGLHNFVVLPFNIDHAVAAASLTMPALRSRPDDYPWATVKDDVKLLGQSEVAGISHFFTDDDKCVINIETLRKSFGARELPFGVYCGDGYIDTWFSPGN